MATTDRDALVRLLGKHTGPSVITDDNNQRWCARCACGDVLQYPDSDPIADTEDPPPQTWVALGKAHRAHLADVIEAHYAERLAEEWGFAIANDMTHVEQTRDEAGAHRLSSGTGWPVVHRYVTEWSEVIDA